MKDWKNIIAWADQQDHAERQREQKAVRKEWVIIVSLTALFGGIAVLSLGFRHGVVATALVLLAVISTLEMRR